MVFETVRALLAQILGCDESRIRPKTIILEDLEATTEDLSELFMGVEEEFGICCDEEATEGIHTVADLVKYIEESM